MVVLKELNLTVSTFEGMAVFTLGTLILTVSTLGGSGSLEITDF